MAPSDSRRLMMVCVLILSVSVISLNRSIHAQAPPKRFDTAISTMSLVMPDAEATLTIDDQIMKAKGAKREFRTPVLETGKDYRYTLTIRWEPNNYTKITRTRIVRFRAGDPISVDLRPEDPNMPDSIVIRYVPTPQVVVDRMMKLADVKAGDIVYDLGCGDGRIVVTAVSKFGAKRGVGVDLDPERIQDSIATAKAANVQDKVEFRQADVLKLKDISDASVVMLYMSDDLNLQLRPTLLSSLKPGSRVVSHRFIMGDWKPDQSITVKDAQGEDYRLHLWTIPERTKK